MSRDKLGRPGTRTEYLPEGTSMSSVQRVPSRVGSTCLRTPPAWVSSRSASPFLGIPTRTKIRKRAVDFLSIRLGKKPFGPNSTIIVSIPSVLGGSSPICASSGCNVSNASNTSVPHLCARPRVLDPDSPVPEPEVPGMAWGAFSLDNVKCLSRFASTIRRIFMTSFSKRSATRAESISR
jgi:hypothetical protein